MDIFILVKLNLASFSSIFELFCAFNFSYATIKPIREGIRRYFKERLKTKLFVDDKLKSLLSIVRDLDNGNNNSLTFNINRQNATAISIVLKLLSTITETFDSISPSKEKYPLFTEKTESLFLCYGFLSLLTLFIGGITSDFSSSLSTLEGAKHLSLRKVIDFWYLSIFIISILTCLYSFYIFFFAKPRGIEISKTFQLYFTIIILGFMLAFLIDYKTTYFIPQTIVTASCIITLVIPYILYFLIPVYQSNFFVSSLMTELDDNIEDVYNVIGSLAINNTTDESINIPNFKDILQ